MWSLLQTPKNPCSNYQSVDNLCFCCRKLIHKANGTNQMANRIETSPAHISPAKLLMKTQLSRRPRDKCLKNKTLKRISSSRWRKEDKLIWGKGWEFQPCYYDEAVLFKGNPKIKMWLENFTKEKSCFAVGSTAGPRLEYFNNGRKKTF